MFCENWKFAGGSWGNDLRIIIQIRHQTLYEGWNFNSGNYLFTTDTK